VDGARRRLPRDFRHRAVVFRGVPPFAARTELVFHERSGVELQLTTGEMADAFLGRRSSRERPRRTQPSGDRRELGGSQRELRRGAVFRLMDAKSPTMRRALLIALLAVCVFLIPKADAH